MINKRVLTVTAGETKLTITILFKSKTSSPGLTSPNAFQVSCNSNVGTRFHFNALSSRLSKLRGFNLWDYCYLLGSLMYEGFQTTPTLGVGGPRFTPSFRFFAALPSVATAQRSKRLKCAFFFFLNKN